MVMDDAHISPERPRAQVQNCSTGSNINNSALL